MVDAVLLEWEGVLADTGDARRDALLRALAGEGVQFSLADYEVLCDGLDVRSAARAALTHAGANDPTLDELVALRARRSFAAELAQGLLLVPGMGERVARIAARARIAVVTRATHDETGTFLRLAGLDHLVAFAVAADDVTDPPPAPALYERALSRLARLGIEASRVVAWVDGSAQLRAARAAGVRTAEPRASALAS